MGVDIMLYNIRGKYYQFEERSVHMGVLMNVQLTAFSNNRIEPTTAIIELLLKELNSLGGYAFLPNMITGQNIDIAAGTIKPVNNLSFLTIDQTVQIVCMNERIDVIFNGNKDNQDTTIEDFLEFAEKALAFVMKQNNVYSNRLAINISLLSDVFEKELRDTKLGKKLCNTLDFYNDGEIEEWLTRTNSRRCINMPQNEVLNVITELSVVKENVTNNKRFLCHMDINTIQENAGYRFAFSDLNCFKHEVLEIIQNLKTNFEELGIDD